MFSIFTVLGYRLLFKVTLFPIVKTLGYSFFLLIFSSLFIAYFHAYISDYPHFLEGEFGFYLNQLLKAQIGSAGVAGILAFSALTTLVIAYNIDFKLPERKNRPAEENEIDEEINIEEPVYQRNPIRRTESVISDDDEAEVQIAPVFNKSLENVVTPPVGVADIDRKSSVSQLIPPIANNLDNLDDESIEEAAVKTEFEIPVNRKPGENRVRESLALETVIPDQEPTIEDQEPEFTVQLSEEEAKAKDLVEQFGTYDPTLDLSSYKHPTVDLLENYGVNKIAVDAEELEANKNKIVETLNNYNIEIDKIKATIGPTVTLYEIIPAPGVRISKIKIWKMI